METLPVLLSRATQRLSYRSLCIPDDLKDRGVDKLPQSYYAQDAQRVWDALHRCAKPNLITTTSLGANLKPSCRGFESLPLFRFVASWVDLYYGGDDDISQDCELQNWIADINTHGLTQSSGLCVCLVFFFMLSLIELQKATFVLLFRFPSDFPHQNRSVAVCHHDGVFLFSPTCCCQLLPGTPASTLRTFNTG